MHWVWCLSFIYSALLHNIAIRFKTWKILNQISIIMWRSSDVLFVWIWCSSLYEVCIMYISCAKSMRNICVTFAYHVRVVCVTCGHHESNDGIVCVSFCVWTICQLSMNHKNIIYVSCAHHYALCTFHVCISCFEAWISYIPLNFSFVNMCLC